METHIAFSLSQHPHHAYDGLIGCFAEHVQAATYWDLYEDTEDNGKYYNQVELLKQK
ncbi:MAG: hypothetical protein AAF639_07375 [Chloroflexota bacterium]